MDQESNVGSEADLGNDRKNSDMMDMQGRQTAASSQYGRGDASSESSNPFRIPTDDLIFTFKDDEKRRKLDDKETNKHKRIWEKNRPAREGCLRKLCETDIEPSALAINPKVQSKVSVMEVNGFTVPTERNKNKENRYRLIEKKREMALVEMMLQTKDKEIERLADHNELRQTGLHCSELMLETDTSSFLEFFAKIQDETKEANKDLDKKKKEKSALQDELRKLQDQCGTLQSGINKNLDVLQGYMIYKDFLEEITPQSRREELAREKAARDQKRQAERAKQESAMKQQQQMAGSNMQGGARKGPARQQQKPEAGKGPTKNAGGEQKITFDLDKTKGKLREILEDGEDVYTVPFSDPQDLLDICDAMEEQALFLIQQGQENEQQLEQKRVEQLETENQMGKDLAGLTQSEEQVKERMTKTLSEKSKLSQIVGGGSNKMLSDNVYNKLSGMIMRIYKLVKPQHPEAGEVPPLTQLLEIEKSIEDCVRFKDIAEERPNNKVLQYMKSEREKLKTEDAAKNDQAKFEAALAAAEERRQKDAARTVPSGGKKVMMRSEKPFFKKEKEDTKQLTQEQEDQLQYLGDLDMIPLVKS